MCITEAKLSSSELENENTYKIIKTFYLNKANDHNEFSITMLIT